MSDANPGDAGPRGLLTGLRYAVRGVPFVLRRPKLLAIAAVPVLINLALLVGLFSVGLRFYDDAFAWAFSWDKPEGLLVAAWWVVYVLMRLLLYLALAVVSFLAVVILGSVIAAPFNDALSERTEREIRGGGTETPFSMARALAEVVTATRDQLVVLAIYLAGLVIIVVFNLVPVAGTLLSSALSFIWTCWFFALEFTDPPLSRWGRRWRERWNLLMGHARLALGFGIGAWLLLFIPLTMPFLFVSGTLLALDLAPPAEASTRPGKGGPDDVSSPHGS